MKTKIITSYYFIIKTMQNILLEKKVDLEEKDSNNLRKRKNLFN